MKKKLAALMLAAMLSVSVSACSGKDDNGSASQTTSNASAVEKADEAPAIDYEVNESIKKAIDDNIPEEKLGKKTKYTVDKFAAQELDIKLSLKLENAGEEKTESSAQTAANPLSGSEIKLDFAKNNDNNIRADMNLAGITLDILYNKDGLYFLDSSTKIATMMPNNKADDTSAADASEKSEDEASSSGGAGIVPGIDSDGIKDAVKSDKNKFEYTGDGEGEFNGQKYSYEGYSMTMDANSLALPMMGGNTTTGSDKAEDIKAEMKVYFDGYDIKGIEFTADKTKVLVTVNTFATKADSSLFEVPSGYKTKEDDGSYMMKLLGMFSALGGGNMDMGETSGIITAD